MKRKDRGERREGIDLSPIDDGDLAADVWDTLTCFTAPLAN